MKEIKEYSYIFSYFSTAIHRRKYLPILERFANLKGLKVKINKNSNFGTNSYTTHKTFPHPWVLIICLLLHKHKKTSIILSS